MGLLEDVSMLVGEEEIEDKEEVETSNESMSAKNFDKFMKGKDDILIPGWLGIFKEEKNDERDIIPWLRKEKAIKEDSEKTEEEKYLESIFKGQKNEFDFIFLALNNNETSSQFLVPKPTVLNVDEVVELAAFKYCIELSIPVKK